MSKAILLCGRIASGKTTLAQKLQAQGNAVLLSCDELMLTLFDQCLGPRHNQMEARCRQYLFTVAEQVVKTGADALLDFGFWTQDAREQAKAYFRERGIPAELWYLPIRREEQLSRLAQRNARLQNSPRREYLIQGELLDRLDAAFEEPLPQEIYKVITA